MDLGETDEIREALLGDGDDDLEFYITFPTPSGPTGGEDDEGFDFAIDPEGSTEPLVFILGWAGSNDRDLAKYSKIYEDRGCITVRYSAPGEYILFDTEKIRPLALKLLDLVSEMSLETSPIFFHCFSNSGATVLQFMTEAMTSEEKYKGLADRIMGQVFDSAPGKRTPVSFINAYSYVWPNNNAFYRFFIPRFMLIYAILVSIYRTIVASVAGKSLGPCCYEYMMTKGLICPFLFIHSKLDVLTTADDINTVADARDQLGCEVTRICFDDTQHVDHLSVHREVYINSVDQFLRKCLEMRSRKTSMES